MEVLSLPAAAAVAPGMGSLYAPLPAGTHSFSSDDGSCTLSPTDSASEQQQEREQQQQQLEAQHAAAVAAHAASQAHLPPEQRTHHLLKHCLSQSQRGNALEHFNTSDAREAAKEIARMGQRELQAKFKEVYGSATKSNNNSWLRRKLYEAVGVAPLKANTKGKARKSAASSQRKSGGHSKARSPKQPAALAKVQQQQQQQQRFPSARLTLGAGMGSAPFYHMPIHSALVSTDVSDSEDSHSCRPGSLHHSHPNSPRSPLGLELADLMFTGCGLTQQAPALPALIPTTGYAPLAMAAALQEPQSPMSGHWADPVSQFAQQAVTAQAGRGMMAPMVDASCDPLAGVAPFKAMDLSQDAAQLWEGGCSAMDCQSSWYFGSQGLDLGALGGGGATLAMPLDSRGVAATLCDEEDDILLDNLNLGVIDVSF